MNTINKNKAKAKTKVQPKENTKQYVYEALCNERGELFTVIFKTKERDKKALLEIGEDLASGWGALCERVKPFLCSTSLTDVYDYDSSEW